ncbi:helix-turn-helix transcriptional regulator [Acidobacteria bacterium AB60]|nr:helix-turn-helix transcriptional regulator [Acidobacteria bacterium AB60]
MAKPIGAGKTRKSGTPRELFGAAITRLRIHRRESQATVSAKVGCEEFYLRNIEQGRENFSFEIMYAIVSYYDMLPLSRFWAYAEKLADRPEHLLN